MKDGGRTFGFSLKTRAQSGSREPLAGIHSQPSRLSWMRPTLQNGELRRVPLSHLNVSIFSVVRIALGGEHFPKCTTGKCFVHPFRLTQSANVSMPRGDCERFRSQQRKGTQAM
ncbi:MAG: hypothetical protein ACE5EK_06075, partial [Nitrospinales bacterium]